MGCAGGEWYGPAAEAHTVRPAFVARSTAEASWSTSACIGTEPEAARHELFTGATRNSSRAGGTLRVACRHTRTSDSLPACRSFFRALAVAVWALDRLRRSMVGAIQTVLELDRLGMPVVSVRERMAQHERARASAAPAGLHVAAADVERADLETLLGDVDGQAGSLARRSRTGELTYPLVGN